MAYLHYIEKMVTAFYTFAGEVYIEYHKLSKKHVTNINDVEYEQTYQEYFLYKLYYNYGVQRCMINEHIALLYYVKNAKGYKPCDMITMLCRHMMLDMRNLRIVSLGIPRAMTLENFTAIYDINVDDISTNFITDTIKMKYLIYNFLEGTMITYNPSLKKYNVNLTVAHNNDITQDEDNEFNQEQINAELIQQNIDKEFTKLCQYSTRKVVGTGRFNSSKTFLEMFNENNNLENVNLDDIPDTLLQDKVLVFNIEHPDNKFINNTPRHMNTLCAVYQFKTDELATQQFNDINYDLYSNHDQLYAKFQNLGTNMVTQLDLTTFVAQLPVKLHIPESISSFSLNDTIDPVENINVTQLVKIANCNSKYSKGYVVYGINGERTKIVNEKYKQLQTLKGNRPIVLEQWNIKNLFYLYWRLMKSQLIPQFIEEYGAEYTQLFLWFANVTGGYAKNLFNVYHSAFVKRTFDKYNIPFSMKPLCGDLHSMYKNNKTPITPTMVNQYIIDQTAGKLFWRLFSGK